MTPTEKLAILDWLSAAALSGADEEALVAGFCQMLAGAGLALRRVLVGSDTLHPVVEGYTVEWRHDRPVRHVVYDRQAMRDAQERWLASPIYHLMTSGDAVLRCRLAAGEGADRFPVLADLRAEGMTDFVAYQTRFGDGAALGEMNALYSSWATDRPGGFDDGEVAALAELVPHLVHAYRSAAAGRIADTLVVTYLGRDPGRRVLKGHIERGVAEARRTVIWLSDLKGFTRIADTVPADRLMALLNDYQECLVAAVDGAGGQVLKFMGDGLLAIFDMHGEGHGGGDSPAPADPALACRQALDAADRAVADIAALTARRADSAAPVTGFYLGLHVGDVLYGNIGSPERLDFTVIGPAVNEASRIAGMCRALDRDVVLSAAFAEAAGPERARLVSLGRYALRGVRLPQELFTLDPEAH
ncbi:MAG: adenylate/guanylate cyclase domain-containing protein [Alphaproteobacteria bacterium]|jgi:adenylate cyclase|nr:adenylate/guanylate cyclase domain-containing protein [Alphaproteobacteria bacterium]